MKAPPRTFDIFSGEIYKNAVWLEAVAGLDEAKARMDQIAHEKPGQYFIYCSTTSSVVAKLETQPKPGRKQKSKGHSA